MRLGDYVNIRTGKLDANASSENGQYPFFTCSVTPLKIDTYSYDCECVLVAGNGDLNVKYYNGKFDAYQRTYIIESRNKEMLSVPYLYCFLDKYVETLRKQAIGGVIKYIKLGNLTDAKINIPTIEEQKSVVSVLDKVNAIINGRKEQLEKLDELVKARFVELFGNPLDGTAKYPIHQVGEVAEAVDPQPSHRTPPIEEGGIPYVSIKDCDYKTGTIDFDGARRVSRKVLEEHLNRYTLQDGDFVIGKIGTIGKPVFVPARNDYTLSANVVLVQPNSELVSPYFLKYSFESDFVERQFSEAKNSTSQAAFGIQKVRAVEVMNPDLDIQRAFERFVKQTDKSKLEVQKSLKKLELLKKALMQKYFG